MKEEKEIVNEIRVKSDKLMQRMVIDEIFSDGSLRVLIAEMKPSVNEEKTINYTSWNKEVERNLNRKQLGELLTEKQIKEIKEGQVFSIRRKRSKNISDDIRKHVKARTKELLDYEGIVRTEIKRRK